MGTQKNKNILLVDDSRTARMYVKRSLESIGYKNCTFFESSNGKEALSLLRQETIDVVIADLNMPQMDGESLLMWIKRAPNLKKIPVIFVTSANNPAKLSEMVEHGAHAVLGKPIAPKMLLEVLQKLFS